MSTPESGASPRGAHLVGSVPLADAAAVFETASAILGQQLRRIPDGETGVRTNWIGWQLAVISSNSALEPVPVDQAAYGMRALFRLRDGVTAGDVRFENLGYADVATGSYATFRDMKQQGTIPSDVRFMVSLPTPLAPIAGFIAPDSQAAVEPPYEARMFEELEQICTSIPHDQLAIQWDVAVEFGMLEDVWPVYFSNVREEIIERLVRIGSRVPGDVEMGYHLCYGDAGHQHFKQPQDTSKLVDIANAVSSGVARPINWIHLPVPIERDDDAYYEPLRQLHLHPETELYLGLVHIADGLEGSRRRTEVAARHVSNFGVATECGFGRRPPETVPDLLKIHAELATAVR